jgi:hypothetical protein
VSETSRKVQCTTERNDSARCHFHRRSRCGRTAIRTDVDIITSLPSVVSFTDCSFVSVFDRSFPQICAEMQYDSEGEQEKVRREKRMEKFAVPSIDIVKQIRKLEDDADFGCRQDPGPNSVRRPNTLHMYTKDSRQVILHALRSLLAALAILISGSFDS